MFFLRVVYRVSRCDVYHDSELSAVFDERRDAARRKTGHKRQGVSRPPPSLTHLPTANMMSNLSRCRRYSRGLTLACAQLTI